MRSANADRVGRSPLWGCVVWVCMVWASPVCLPSAWAADVPGMSFSKLVRCSDAASTPSSVTPSSVTPTDANQGDANSTSFSSSSCWRAPAELGQAELILAQGQIERQSSDLLAQFASELPRGTTVVFQSMGGDLLGGLRLGQLIRARGFNTYLPARLEGSESTLKDTKWQGKCISSCAYSFLGGLERKVQSGGQYGVHQFRGLDNGLDPVQTQKISAILGKYMDAMGVSRLLLDQALMTDPGKVMFVPEHLRQAWKVDTASDTSEAVLPRWRLEASTGGQRLAYVSRRQSKSNAIVTLAFVSIGTQMKALLIVKPDARQEGASNWLDFFRQRTDLQLTLDGRSFTLGPSSDWAQAGKVNTQGTQQIWFTAPDDLVRELRSAKQLVLRPQWAQVPLGLDSQTLFGTEGLREALLAL